MQVDGRRWRRIRGAGTLLVLVLVILLIIVFTGMGQSLFSSQVINATHRASLGNLCQFVAESACEELLHQVQTEANDPSSPSFEAFRSKVFGEGPDPFVVPLQGGGNLPHTLALVDGLGAGGARIGVDQVKVEMIFRRQLCNLSYETYGLLHLQARSSAGLLEGVERRVDAYRDVKVALASPPRPFGRLAVFLGTARNVVLTEGPNRGIALSYRQIRAVWAYFDELKRSLEAEGADAAMVDEAAASLQAVEEAATTEAGGCLVVGRDGRSAQAPYDWTDMPEPLPEAQGGPHYFGDPTVAGEPLVERADDLMIVVGGEAGAVDLSQLDLQGKLVPLEEAATTADEAFTKTRDEVKAALESLQGDPTGLTTDTSAIQELSRKLREAAVAAVKAHRAVLVAYHEFQVLVGEKSGESRVHWEQAFVVKKLKLEHWQAKAFYTVRSGVGLADLINAVHPLSGVVYVDSAEPVTVEGIRHEGKLIIVTRGPLEIRDAGVADAAVDQLTFVSFGETRLAGRIQASVIQGLSPGGRPRLVTEPGLNLTGNLVAAGGLNIDPGSLQGSLTFDPTLDSGDTGPTEKHGHHVVAISPTVRARAVKR